MAKKSKQIQFTPRVMFQVLGKGFSLLFCPTEKRINKIMSDPIAGDEKLVNKVIYWWLSLLMFVISVLGLLYLHFYVYEREFYASVLDIFLGTVIYTLLFVVFFGVSHMVATRWFGGNNAHHRFLFTLGSVIVPFIILGVMPSGSLTLIVPSWVETNMQYLNIYDYTFMIYGFVLNIKILKTIYRYSYIKAIGTLVVTLIGLFIIAGILFALIGTNLSRFIR